MKWIEAVLFFLVVCANRKNHCAGTDTEIHAGPDNRGTEFMLMFNENFNLNPSNFEDFEIEVYVTTAVSDIVYFNVSTPGWDDPQAVNIQSNVTRGQVRQLYLPHALRHIGTKVSNKAVLITSSSEIVVYSINKQVYSNDGFLGLPTDVLGTEYYTVSYAPAYRHCQFGIVAIEDDTNITITLGRQQYPDGQMTEITYNGQVFYNGDDITVTLNRYGTMQIQAANANDLTGSHVVSDKPVAVFSGNKKTNVGSGNTQDHLVEQMTPVNTWGKTFATVPIPGRDHFKPGDVFRFVASEDNTTISITGIPQEPDAQLNLSRAGDFVEKIIGASFSNVYTLITADKPIMVVQIVQSQLGFKEPSDPAMILIPPIEQYEADYAFTTPKYSLGSYENYLMVIVRANESDGLQFNLDHTDDYNITWYDIPGTEYRGSRFQVDEGTHVLSHVSSISTFGVFMFGSAVWESYGFPGGMRLAPINKVCTRTLMVPGDGVDNDCDGQIDEEMCSNNIDDDYDGLIEEDCACVPSTMVVDDDIDNDCDGQHDEEICGNDIDDDGDGVHDEDCDNIFMTSAIPTTDYPTTAEHSTTEEQQTTTEARKTTEQPTNIKQEITTEQPTTTEQEATTLQKTTIDIRTTTEQKMTTEQQTTTEQPTTAEQRTTTERRATAIKQTTTEETTTTEQPTTNEQQTSTKQQTTTELQTTTDLQTTADQQTTLGHPTTTEQAITTERQTTTDQQPTTKQRTTVAQQTTTEQHSTAEQKTTTRQQTTVEQQTTMGQPTTTEKAMTTEHLMSTEQQITTEQMTTMKQQTTTEQPDPVPSTTTAPKTTSQHPTRTKHTTTIKSTSPSTTSTNSPRTTTAATTPPKNILDFYNNHNKTNNINSQGDYINGNDTYSSWCWDSGWITWSNVLGEQ
ncbi:uncharacterized protein LOC112042687 [Lingula anatina]|uniref:Uncharacterized protein LOC112042687 n=1 Tax=Lingula anatina TaxID=7574 RepID=A0A2R2MTG3_LINAN|nr:uncharacterized protein LOC112042687 [Lingula anatina]|eukprot:XP_023933408.1 uncharacterized protein LOC112042687 [Lingula anatina]